MIKNKSSRNHEDPQIEGLANMREEVNHPRISNDFTVLALCN